jgi:hypothetical protein
MTVSGSFQQYNDDFSAPIGLFSQNVDFTRERLLSSPSLKTRDTEDFSVLRVLFAFSFEFGKGKKHYHSRRVSERPKPPWNLAFSWYFFTIEKNREN